LLVLGANIAFQQQLSSQYGAMNETAEKTSVTIANKPGGPELAVERTLKTTRPVTGSDWPGN